MEYGEDPVVEDAKLSQGAYGNDQIVDGWTRDNELSNDNRSVYTKDGKAKIAFRGTDLKSSKRRWGDIGSDLLIGLGLQDLSSRMKNAKKTTDKAIEKYGRENVSLTGHSLGGTQALYVNRKRGLETKAYNAGFSPVDMLTSRKYKNATHYTADGDIISKYGRGTKGIKDVRVKPKSWNSHSLVNFI